MVSRAVLRVCVRVVCMCVYVRKRMFRQTHKQPVFSCALLPTRRTHKQTDTSSPSDISGVSAIFKDLDDGRDKEVEVVIEAGPTQLESTHHLV